MTRIIMHGCNGRMGQMIVEICAEDTETEIVAGVDTAKVHPYPFPVVTNIRDCEVQADVVIDFSTAGAVDQVLDYCIERKLPLVLCTTGLSEEQLAKTDAASRTVAVLKSANMSLGINTLFELLQKAAAALAPAGFDIEIVEKHHNQKLDAPSGTALALADVINGAMDGAYEYKYDRSKERRKRGSHEIIFAGKDEVIEIKHTAYSRAVFGKGAVEAAKFLKGKEPGYYNMQNVVSSR